MNQREFSSFFRYVLLFILGAGALELLSSIDRPWARLIGTAGGVVLFLGLGAFIIFTSVKEFKAFVSAPVRDEPLPPSLRLDRWHRVAELAVAASLLSAIILVAVLLFVEPPKQCPNWDVPSQGSSTPLRLLLFMWTIPVLAGAAFVVVRWDWTIRKAIDSADYPTEVPVSYVLVVTVLTACAMSQFPWLILVSKCLLE